MQKTMRTKHRFKRKRNKPLRWRRMLWTVVPWRRELERYPARSCDIDTLWLVRCGWKLDAGR